MVRPLNNFTGVDVPDLTDPQPTASGLISGAVGGNDFVTAVDNHDHSPGKGLPIPLGALFVDGNLDMQGFSILNIDEMTGNGASALLLDSELAMNGNPITSAGQIDGSGLNLLGGDITNFERIGAVGDTVAASLPSRAFGFVNGDFTVRDGVGVLQTLGVAVLPQGYVDGYQVSFGSATTINVSAGKARNSTNIFDISSGSLLINTAVSGAGGLDTGSMALNSVYYVFVIADTSLVNPVSGLISLSDTAPTLPAGYNVFRRVGSVFTQTASTNIEEFKSFNSSSNVRTYVRRFGSVVFTGDPPASGDILVTPKLPPLASKGMFLFSASGGVGDIVQFGSVPGTDDFLTVQYELGQTTEVSNFSINLFNGGFRFVADLTITLMTIAAVGWEEEI